MKSLARRSAEYYIKQGLKMFGLVMVLQLILAVEWLIMGIDGMDYIIQNIVSFTGMFTILFNTLQAVYGPNWFDSVVLSMGARRKDIFWGGIIQQVTFILCCTAVSLAVSVIFNHMEYIGFTFLTFVAAFLFGVIGTIIGYKIKKFGKIVLFVIIIITSGIGGAVGAMTAIGKHFEFGGLNSGVVLTVAGVATVILFVLLEFWAYSLNRKCMVK